MKLETRSDYRGRRHKRLRQKISGTAARPRFSVYVSNKHMEVQLVDDDAGVTLVSATTRGKADINLNLAAAKSVGEKIAEAAKAKGISLVVIDRGGYKYHGRVKTVVEAALAAGLKVNEDQETK